MKKLLVFCFLVLYIILLNAAGVIVNRNNTQFQVAQLQSCDYEVDINNQIAEIKVTDSFVNHSNSYIYPRYYFPIPRGANATQLRWFINGEWYSASIAGVPPSTPGGPITFPSNFEDYILYMPVTFDIPDSLATNAEVKVELSYVQMLNDNFGSLTINLKNDYSLIQTTPLAEQSLQINVYSDKSIIDFDILNVTAIATHTEHSANGSYNIQNSPASANYRCVIRLSTATYNSWGISTFLAEAPDEQEQGFFIYTIEEPSLPADSTYSKNVIIVIDVSGSMTWENRINDAKIAASYILNNLNPGDNFNVILFDHVIRSLGSTMLPYNPGNLQIALSYVNNYQITSLNGTNLYGAMNTAVSQMIPVPDSRKNCIILLSDGQPNVGTTDTYQIINNINLQIGYNHSDPSIFCFGIGSEVNYQLLNALSQHHNGIAIFLESAEIINTITSFFDVMFNPLIKNPSIINAPQALITEIYPDPFPALYGGMQYRIMGRYLLPTTMQIGITGNHYGFPLSYNYQYELSTNENMELGFIPKIWASAKIDKLLIEYYSYPPSSTAAIDLRQQIIDLSLSFGVVCVFTSFTPDTPPTEVEDEYINPPLSEIVLNPNYPNPFNPSTTISFQVFTDTKDVAEIRIYNLKGQVVRILFVEVNGKGIYEIVWNGEDTHDHCLPSGVYVYTIRCGKHILHGKMTMMK